MNNESLYNWKPTKGKPIDPGKLRDLFAEGKTEKEIAVYFGLSVNRLQRRINWSASLTEAKNRGLREFKEKV